MKLQEPASKKNKILFFLSYLGIDRITVWALFSKFSQMVSTLGTTILVSVFFSKEEQGYFYTFLSIISLQVFLEFGLGAVISSYASHEWAHLKLSPSGEILGDSNALSRLISLGNFTKNYYGKISTACFFLLLICGGIFFYKNNPSNIEMWIIPWVCLCLLTSTNLFLVPYWAILEGCNQMEIFFQFKFLQAFSVGVISWVTIYLGFGLLATTTAGFFGIIVIYIMMRRRCKSFFSKIFYSYPFADKLNWKVDIFPMQWRIGVSWISGYLTFSLIVPIVFYFKGPILAGQVGMTLFFITAITSVISAWVYPKNASMAILIAKSEFKALNQIFYLMSYRVALISMGLAVLVWLGIYFLNIYNVSIAERLLGPIPSAYFLGGGVILCVSLPMSTYLRAHKKEPLLLISILCGVTTSTAIFFSAKYHAIETVALSYFICLLFYMPLIIIIWIKFRKKHHVINTKKN